MSCQAKHCTCPAKNGIVFRHHLTWPDYHVSFSLEILFMPLQRPIYINTELQYCITTRVRIWRVFWYPSIAKDYERLTNSVRVFRPHWRNFKANDLKHNCVSACATIECLSFQLIVRPLITTTDAMKYIFPDLKRKQTFFRLYGLDQAVTESQNCSCQEFSQLSHTASQSYYTSL